MPTLFLSAPESKNQPSTNHRDFSTILSSGIGPDYGIYNNLIGQVCSGMKVVVFDRDRRLRADGAVASYTQSSKAGNGVQRYNVRIVNLERKENYTNPPRVNRFGVAVK